MADLLTLTDNFNDNSIDSGLWGVGENNGTVTETGQQLQLAVTPNTSGALALVYSQNDYSLTGSSVSVNLIQGAAPGTDTVVALGEPDTPGNRLIFTFDGAGTIAASYDIGYTSQASDTASVTVGVDFYVRIREVAGTVYWDYSENGGSSWTNVLSYATSSITFSIALLTLSLEVYEWSATGATTESTTIFDNINTLVAGDAEIDVNDGIEIIDVASRTVDDVVGDANVNVSDTVSLEESNLSSSSSEAVGSEISNLVDAFADDSINTILWAVGENNGTVTETNQQIQMAVVPETAGALALLYTKEGYSLVGSIITVNMVQAASPGTDTSLTLGVDGTPGNRLIFVFGGGTLTASYDVGYASQSSNTASVTPGSGFFVRIREAGGSVYWDYSENGGASWTNVHSQETSGITFSLENLIVGLEVYEWSATGGTTETTSIFDNINTLDVQTPNINVFETINIGESETAISGDTYDQKTKPFLAMNVFTTQDNLWYAPDSVFDGFCDELIAVGFTHIRAEQTTYTDLGAIAHTQAAVLRAIAKGLHVSWGPGAGGTTLTASTWPDYAQAVQDAAQWAQDNDLPQFSIGNEEEMHIDETTITVNQVIDNIKALATTVKSIYTKGPLIYSTYPLAYDRWRIVGKGDLDLLGVNQYMSGDTPEWSGTQDDDKFKGWLDDLIDSFGTDGFIITEWGPSWRPHDDFGSEAFQAQKVAEALEWMDERGIQRAYFFTYYQDPRPFGPAGFGVRETDGSYNLMWNSLVSTVQGYGASPSDLILVSESVSVNIQNLVIETSDTVLTGENNEVVLTVVNDENNLAAAIIDEVEVVGIISTFLDTLSVEVADETEIIEARWSSQDLPPGYTFSWSVYDELPLVDIADTVFNRETQFSFSVRPRGSFGSKITPGWGGRSKTF